MKYVPGDSGKPVPQFLQKTGLMSAVLCPAFVSSQPGFFAFPWKQILPVKPTVNHTDVTGSTVTPCQKHGPGVGANRGRVVLARQEWSQH